jgi:hypothetical protein
MSEEKIMKRKALIKDKEIETKKLSYSAVRVGQQQQIQKYLLHSKLTFCKPS